MPAATIWPAPLSLAGVRPWRSSVASTSLAVAAEHGGHAGRRDGGRLGHRPAALAHQHHRLRRRHHRRRRRPRRARRRCARRRRATSEATVGAGAARARRPGRWRRGAAGRSGCRGWCRRRPRCRSAPGRARPPSASRREAVGEGRRPRATGTRKPGVWAPCPGATMTSTTSTSARSAPAARACGAHESGATFFVGILQRYSGAQASSRLPAEHQGDLEGERVARQGGRQPGEVGRPAAAGSARCWGARTAPARCPRSPAPCSRKYAASVSSSSPRARCSGR